MSVPVSDVSDEESQANTPTEPATRGGADVSDRADAPVSEIAERFLRAVIAEVPLELIEELHLFSPLRQGTVETGIAVLAARRPVVEAPVEIVETVEELDPELALEEVEIESELDADASDTDASVVDASAADASAVDASDTEESETPVSAEIASELSASEVPASAPLAVPVPAPQERHTVFTARYRYVIKGPERGKWESNLKAEADAPLVTVETVVRGVQRRAGEESEIVRYTAAQIARALRMDLQG
ncbi:MAG: hypothetical protein IBJ03_04610 [Gemmatimonadaceae bacterium]|nr:hypothetical protein [Gemmatimonadaceae bacterium]